MPSLSPQGSIAAEADGKTASNRSEELQRVLIDAIYASRTTPLLQQGVCRTNCIDCLDRTNAAQFAIAKAALELQLHALGLLQEPFLSYDNDAIGLFKNNWHE